MANPASFNSIEDARNGLSSLYREARQLVQDSSASREQFTLHIEQNPAIATRLLGLFNSTYFGIATRLNTIQQAVTLIDMEALHDLLLCMNVIGLLAATDREPDGLCDWWRRQLRCGMMCRSIADECGVSHASRLFIAGLLHDVSGRYHALFGYHGADTPTDSLAQSLSRTETIAELFGQWQLPDALIDAVRYQDCPQQAPTHREHASVLYLARCYSNCMDTEDILFKPALGQSLQCLSCDAARLRRLRADIDLYEEETLAFLLPEAPVYAA